MTGAVARHLGRELPVDGVVCEEMREGRGIGDVVDGDDLQIGASLVGRAHEAAADAAEAVDGDLNGHGQYPFLAFLALSGAGLRLGH
jgi:hypothetical protein